MSHALRLKLLVSACSSLALVSASLSSDASLSSHADRLNRSAVPNKTRKTRQASLATTIEQMMPSIVVVHAKAGEGKRIVGTGFCVRRDGYLITAKHIVEGGDVRVGVFYKGEYISVTAKVIGEDKVADIAVIKIDRDIPPIRMNLSARKAGEMVAATGFPFGPTIDRYFVPSTSSGIISCIRPFVGGEKHYGLLQLDMIIEKGNSGGPVFLPNSGEVIGVVTSNLVPLDPDVANIRVGFAVPIQSVRTLINRFLPPQSAPKIQRSKPASVTGVTVKSLNR